MREEDELRRNLLSIAVRGSLGRLFIIVSQIDKISRVTTPPADSDLISGR
jgi:hypothetical protein